MSGWGGVREGAGRKPNVVRYGEQIVNLVDQTNTNLDQTFRRIVDLAEGKSETVIETWMAAGTLIRKSGKRITRLYKNEDLERLILVKKKVVRHPPNLAANEYLVNRILGKPHQQIDLADLREAIKGTEKLDLSNLTLEEIKLLQYILGKTDEDYEEPNPEPGSPERRELREQRRKQACALLLPEDRLILEAPLPPTPAPATPLPTRAPAEEEEIAREMEEEDYEALADYE